MKYRRNGVTRSGFPPMFVSSRRMTRMLSSSGARTVISCFTPGNWCVQRMQPFGTSRVWVHSSAARNSFPSISTPCRNQPSVSRSYFGSPYRRPDRKTPEYRLCGWLPFQSTASQSEPFPRTGGTYRSGICAPEPFRVFISSGVEAQTIGASVRRNKKERRIRFI